MPYIMQVILLGQYAGNCAVYPACHLAENYLGNYIGQYTGHYVGHYASLYACHHSGHYESHYSRHYKFVYTTDFASNNVGQAYFYTGYRSLVASNNN